MKYFRENNAVLNNQRGVALLITLVVITLLMTTIFELNRRGRNYLESSAISKDQIALFNMAKSGMIAARMLLIKDRKDTSIDSLHEEWADPDLLNDLVSDMPFERGRITLNIEDELGKVQVNALVEFPDGKAFDENQKSLWNRMLSVVIDVEDPDDDSHPIAIINSLKDWLDSGDDDLITGLSGAESDYYGQLDPPYACRNAPIPDIDELLLVKGVTEDMFVKAGGASEISNYFSVYGMTKPEGGKFTYDGKININTASIAVIAALLKQEDEDLAPNIISYRQEKSGESYTHDLSKIDWYKKARDCDDVVLNSEVIALVSDVFRIKCTAEIGKTKRTLVEIVQRETDKTGKWSCRVLNSFWD